MLDSIAPMSTYNTGHVQFLNVSTGVKAAAYRVGAASGQAETAVLQVEFRVLESEAVRALVAETPTAPLELQARHLGLKI